MGDGQTDMVVRYIDQVYVFRFEVVNDAPAGRAMAQTVGPNFAEAHRI